MRPLPNSAAFTLVELLTSVALGTLILLVVFSALGTGLDLWGRSVARIESLGDARFALQRMGGEVAASLPPARADLVENLPAHLQAAGGSLTLDDGSTLAAESLFLVAPGLNRDSGDLCVTIYRLNTETLVLERAFLDSSAAFSPATGDRYRYSSYPAASLDWRPMVDGAVEFEVICYEDTPPPDPAKIIPNWDSTKEGRPSRITLRIRAVSTRTQTLIQEIGLEAAADLIERESAELRRDISLR